MTVAIVGSRALTALSTSMILSSAKRLSLSSHTPWPFSTVTMGNLAIVSIAAEE